MTADQNSMSLQSRIIAGALSVLRGVWEFAVGAFRSASKLFKIILIIVFCGMILFVALDRFISPVTDKTAALIADSVFAFGAVNAVAHRFGEELEQLTDKIAVDTSITKALLTRRNTQRIAFRRLLQLAKKEVPQSRIVNRYLPGGNPIDNYYAIYDTSKRLIAWSGNPPIAACFDSVLNPPFDPAEKLRVTYVENGPIISRLFLFKKILSNDDIPIGYVLGQRLLSADVSLFSLQKSGIDYSFLDDIQYEAVRYLQLNHYAPVPDRGERKAFHNDGRYVYADSLDPQSFIGMLSVNPAGSLSANETKGMSSIPADVFTIVFLLLVHFLFIYRIAYDSDYESTMSQRNKILYVIAFCVSLRLSLYLVGAGMTFLSGSFIDPVLFGVPNFGLINSPNELFISISILFTFCLVLYRILFGGTIKNDTNSSSLKKVLAVVVPLAFALLISILWESILSFIVSNGNFPFLRWGEMFSDGGALFITFSLLLFGFSCVLLFIACVVRILLRITFTNWIVQNGFTPSQLLAVYIGLYGVFLVFAGVLSAYSHFSFFYWSIHYFVLVVLGGLVFIFNIIRRGSGIEYESRATISRLPRSSVAALSIMSTAALLMSPCINTLEFEKLKATTEQEVLSRTTFEVNSLAPILQTTLAELDADPKVADLRLRLDAHDLPLVYSMLINKHITNATVDVSQHRPMDTGRSSDDIHIMKVRDSLLRTFLDTSDSASFRIEQGGDVNENIFSPVIAVAKVRTGKDSVVLLDITITHRSQDNVRAKFLDDPRLSYSSKRSMMPQSSSGVVYSTYIGNSLSETSTPNLSQPAALSSTLKEASEKDEGVWTSTVISKQGHHSFVKTFDTPTKDESTLPILVASIRYPDPTDHLALFLFLNSAGFFLALGILLLTLIVKFAVTGSVMVSVRFRDRLFGIVLALAIIPLVTITNVTGSLLSDRSTNERLQQSIAQSTAITDDIARRLEGGYKQHQIENLLKEISPIVDKHLDFYSIEGRLIASDNQDVYSASFLSPQLPIEAVREILVGKKNTFTDVRNQDSDDRYFITYRSIRNTSGAVIGVLGLTDNTQYWTEQADISTTIRTIYGVFTLVSLLLLILGSYISYRISYPIYNLIKATEDVAAGALGTSVVVNRKDEFGDLATAFNRMSSELATTRDRVAQSEREGAWKEMARQVAHEIKNPLTPMKLSVQHVEYAFEKNDPSFASTFKRVVRTLTEQIDVLTRIATEFARFGEMPRRKYAFISLYNVAESAIALFDSERSRIRFVNDIPQDISAIYADEEEFRRTLVNLIRNSIQAIEKWGAILLTAEEKGGLIHFHLTDTGGGMAEDVLQKVFDPNFSTKTSGMGLGLAIVKRTITDMSGTISVTSELGKGTSFHIDLPAKEQNS